MKTQNNFIFTIMSCLYSVNTKMHQNVQLINADLSNLCSKLTYMYCIYLQTLTYVIY